MRGLGQPPEGAIDFAGLERAYRRQLEGLPMFPVAIIEIELQRVPARYKLRLRDDLHREVRIRIAGELDDGDLVPMLGDSDYYVRLVVARRIDSRLLRPLISDPEPEVRRVVASRLPLAMLAPMAYDPDPAVRLHTAERMSAQAIAYMRDDEDWRIP